LKIIRLESVSDPGHTRPEQIGNNHLVQVSREPEKKNWGAEENGETKGNCGNVDQ